MKLLLVSAIFLNPLQPIIADQKSCQYNVDENTGVVVSRGKPSMELILAALAGIGGVALLLSPRAPLPSEADYKKALDKLATTPEDPDANTIVGKYLAFVTGDYDQGMVYLAKSSDKTLKTLAEHERAPLYADTPPKKVGMGDEWVAAAKSFPALFRIFYDRAAHWYMTAWPDLDNIWKDKAREQAHKLAASRPPGPGRKGLPSGWLPEATAPWQRSPVLDGSIARTGSYSVKIIPGDEKLNKNAYSQLNSEQFPVFGKTLEFSAYLLTDGTDSKKDQIRIDFFDKTGAWLGAFGTTSIPSDLPYWNRVYAKVEIPEETVKGRLTTILYSHNGNMWIDDASVKVDGKEILKNPSFEGK